MALYAVDIYLFTIVVYMLSVCVFVEYYDTVAIKIHYIIDICVTDVYIVLYAVCVYYM